jgi:cytochrome P450
VTSGSRDGERIRVADQRAVNPARAAPVYRGAPILGALTHFRDDMLGTLVRAEGLGPVVRFRIAAGVPIRSFGLFSPQGAAQMLGGSGDYRKDSRPYVETRAFFGNGLLTSQDERWRRQRRFVAPLFSSRRLEREYVPILVEEAERMRVTWRACYPGLGRSSPVPTAT